MKLSCGIRRNLQWLIKNSITHESLSRDILTFIKITLVSSPNAFTVIQQNRALYDPYCPFLNEIWVYALFIFLSNLFGNPMHYELLLFFSFCQDCENHYRHVLSVYRTRLLSAAQVTFYFCIIYMIFLSNVLSKHSHEDESVSASEAVLFFCRVTWMKRPEWLCFRSPRWERSVCVEHSVCCCVCVCVWERERGVCVLSIQCAAVAVCVCVCVCVRNCLKAGTFRFLVF